MPRARAVPVEEFVDAVRRYEDVIFVGNSTKCVGSGHEIWKTVANDLRNRITPKYAYTMIHENRGNSLLLLNREHCSSSSSENGYATSDSDRTREEMKKFDLNISWSDWTKIRPKRVEYGPRAYHVLEPGKWADLLYEYFWNVTKLQCSLTFKRCKVQAEGQDYCKMSGQCTACGSKFSGFVHKKPVQDEDVKVECCLLGPYLQCTSMKKRRLSKNRVETFAAEQIEKGIAASQIRRNLAADLMNFGDSEPGHVPSGQALRAAKWRASKEGRTCDDAILAVCMLKSEYILGTNTIHDIGYDRFFVHYWTATELNLYREYVKRNRISSTICIDATGSLIRRPVLLNGRKTKAILLYEIAVNDKEANVQFSVGHMLSERHDNNSINHWLTEWIRCKVPCPKQVVTDMSLALLSGVVKAFTPYNTLWHYIEKCYEALESEADVKETIPCFIRCDVAHVIKSITVWKQMRTVDKRIKEFITRVCGQILLSNEIADVKSLLECLFWILYSQTDGVNRQGSETLAEKGRRVLRDRIATGSLERFQTEFNSLETARLESHDSVVDDESPISDQDEVDEDTGELRLSKTSTNNPFYVMAYEIARKCKNDVEIEPDGDHDNLYYVPSVVPRILDLCAYLPLWSGILCRKLGFGDIPASSTAVESQFSELKNRIFRKENLPMRLDDFLKTHIKALNGAANLIHSKIANEHSAPSTDLHNDSPLILENAGEISVNSISDRTGTHQIVPTDRSAPQHMVTLPRNTEEISGNSISGSTHEIVPTERSVPEQTATSNVACPVCRNGDLPSGAHTCLSCHRPVHILDECSRSVGEEEGYGERRLCSSCATSSKKSESAVGGITKTRKRQKEITTHKSTEVQSKVARRTNSSPHTEERTSIEDLLRSPTSSIGIQESTSANETSPHTSQGEIQKIVESAAEEGWQKRKPRAQRKPSIYLTPKRELLFIDEKSRVAKKIIGLLKNGSNPKLSAVKIPGGSFVIHNTCAFDSILQILAVASSDSDKYLTFVEEEKGRMRLFDLIFKILKKGITYESYRTRAKILVYMTIDMEELFVPAGLRQLRMEQSVEYLLPRLLEDYPSARLSTECSTCHSEKMENISMFTVCLTITGSEFARMLSQEIAANFLRTMDEVVVQGKCGESCDVQNTLLAANHLIFSVVNYGVIEEHDMSHMTVKLDNIPKHLTVEDEVYHLRGIVSTPQTQKMASKHTQLGHYVAYCYRAPLNLWQLYDDLKSQVDEYVSPKKIVPVQLFFYTR